MITSPTFRLSLAVARLPLMALVCGAVMNSAFAAPSLMTPAAGATSARTQFDIKSEAMPIMLNRVALERLQKQDEFELVLPNATRHMIVFDRIEEHGGGMRSSVGYLKGLGTDYRAIITTGPSGTFGSIRTPDNIYSIVPGADGHDLLVDMNEEHKHIPYVDLGRDGRHPPVSLNAGAKNRGVVSTQQRAATQPVEAAIALNAPAPQATIDLMIVYTTGLKTRLGLAGLQTRLNHLVTAANTAYIDSEVAITLRLVNMTEVNYPDGAAGVDNATALDAITPVLNFANPPVQGGMGVFSAIETTRSASGADMVAFLRDGGDYSGSGLSWITPVTPDPNYMYSVVTGCVFGCEAVFIHELGHSMGNNHDRATEAFQQGTTTPFSGGNPDAFGHFYCEAGLNCNPLLGACSVQPKCNSTTANNIGTIMSYFNPTTLKFSNPNLMCSNPTGTPQPCGVLGQADNARSMNAMRAALRDIKLSVSPPSSTAVTSSPNPSLVGQSVTFTASVAGNQSIPTGTITFSDGSSVITGCNLVALSSAGAAICQTSALNAGSHNITAAYSGSVSYNASSGTVTQTVNVPNFAVSVTKAGNGNGQVTSSPSGINTATNNTNASFSGGTSVNLTAVPLSGSSFGSWDVGGCGVNPVCVITTATSIVATFNIIQTAPDAPIIGAATPGNQQAMIAFTAPASNGGSAITRYTATCNPGALSATSLTSPITVASMINNTAYSCAVTATNSIGTSPVSPPVAVTPAQSATLALVNVVSRKTHGTAGIFNLTIDTLPTVTGLVTVESRSIGAGHSVVFHFNNSLTNAGTLTVVNAAGATVPASAVVSGSDVIVSIPVLADNKRLTLSLAGVNGILTPNPVSMGFLVGDTNSSRSVNSADINGVKAHVGQTLSLANFMFDVNATGAIDASDVSAVKMHAGTVLP